MQDELVEEDEQERKTVRSLSVQQIIYYAACGIALGGLGSASEILLSLNVFSTFMTDVSRSISGQTYYMYGAVICGVLFLCLPRFLKAHSKLVILAGGLIFCITLGLCYFGQFSSYLLPATALLILVSIGFNLTKYMLLYFLASAKNFSWFVMCMAMSRVAIMIFLSSARTMDMQMQARFTTIIIAVSMLSLIVFCTVDQTKVASDENHRLFQKNRPTNYLIMQAAFLTIVLATLRTFTPLSEYSAFPDMSVGLYFLMSLSVPLLAWLLFIRKKTKDFQTSYVASFFILIFGLFLIAFQSNATWLISAPMSTALILCMMNFGHVAFWNATVAVCWTKEKYTLQIIGVAMSCFSICSVFWFVILGNIGDVAITLVVLLSYICVLAAWKLFPHIIVKKETAPPDNARRLKEIAKEYNLSPRETEVFMLLAQGRSRRYIQEKLFISDGTVKTHTSRIYQKLAVSDKQSMLELLLDKKGYLSENLETEDNHDEE